ncbi:hypothetical protein NP233_g2590 [Leucocoprinus birnbaumii]|uniref:Uncharacterized protein n=1 Tax=Leucocoprinus birnbaumii TaxID=56174 RepID=A0AAD5YUQ5_9AGAR|nr:hypothetical protein NP233_g2590 [Leucocoprinus birnbaumii]
MENMDRELIIRWEEVDPPKVLVRPWKATFENERNGTKDAMEIVLKSYLESDNFIISDYAAAEGLDTTKSTRPFQYLLCGISQADKDRLLECPVIASEQGTVVIAPFSQQMPPFLVSIEGTSCKNNDTGKAAILSAATKTLRGAVSIASWFEDVAGQGAFGDITENLDAKWQMANPETRIGVWNIYTNKMPQNILLADYLDLTAKLRTLTFRTTLNGNGKGARTFECKNCKSIDHPSSTCPFYDIRGWLGPTRDQPEQGNRSERPERSDERRGSWNRGRGRGGPRGGYANKPPSFRNRT